MIYFNYNKKNTIFIFAFNLKSPKNIINFSNFYYNNYYNLKKSLFKKNNFKIFIVYFIFAIYIFLKIGKKFKLYIILKI